MDTANITKTIKGYDGLVGVRVRAGEYPVIDITSDNYGDAVIIEMPDGRAISVDGAYFQGDVDFDLNPIDPEHTISRG